MADQMKAVVLVRFGGVDAFELRDVSVPQVEPRQMRVRVHATAVNPLDFQIRHGDCAGRRACFKGFLAVSLIRYLELLDWTGLQLQLDKIDAIPKYLAPILSRIGLDPPGWCDVVRRFGGVFKRAAGTPESLAQEAIRCGQSWLCAKENPLGLSRA